MEPVAYVDGLPVAARAPDALHTNIQVANVKIRAVMAMIDDRHDGREVGGSVIHGITFSDSSGRCRWYGSKADERDHEQVAKHSVIL